MEGKVRNALLLSFAALASLLSSSSPLPRRPLTNSDSATSLTAPLVPVDGILPTNPSPEQRFLRDSLRVKALTTTGAFGGSAENRRKLFYYTRLSVGTPPQNVKMILDTGSDLVWLRCSKNSNSQTFAKVSCQSPSCQPPLKCSQSNRCQYNQTYGDKSSSFGDLSTETLVFGGVRFERLTFGCSLHEDGDFADLDGILGLGRGHLSFSSQTRTRFNGKFSYCLADQKKPSPKGSSIDFGDGDVAGNTVFTPMLKNLHHQSYYYVELLGISVGGTRVPGVDASVFQMNEEDGGVIVDSGTTHTHLAEPTYTKVWDAFRVGLKLVNPGKQMDKCFNLTETESPGMVLHFRGADVALPSENCRYRSKDDIWCFAFQLNENNSPSVIIGNVQQRGIRVVYDLDGSRVGFAPNACT